MKRSAWFGLGARIVSRYGVAAVVVVVQVTFRAGFPN